MPGSAITSSIALMLLALMPMRARSSEPAVTPPIKVPLTRGLVMVSALEWEGGDRENVVTVEQQTPAGVTYTWKTRRPRADGGTDELEFRRTVRTVDLEKATRLHTVYWPDDQTDYPGYTGFSVSTAVYDSLLGSGEAAFSMVALPAGQRADSALVGGLLRQTTRLRGTLRLSSKQPQAFSVLHNGARVRVPALEAKGSFEGDGRVDEASIWVLADRAHPLLLKSVMGKDRWQIVRIETPRNGAIEQSLARDCRVELPGIYFDFSDARIDERSRDALAAVARILTEHPDWSVLIEGHTDDIGAESANAKLSQARADAVVANLTRVHAVAPARLRAAGVGESRPRESNATLEGRARNRRVEMVRACN